jgi:hypothetical protein
VNASAHDEEDDPPGVMPLRFGKIATFASIPTKRWPNETSPVTPGSR